MSDMTPQRPNPKIKYTPEQMARIRELSSKGGKRGSIDDKRRAGLAAWANRGMPGWKSPGRKKGQRGRNPQPTVATATTPAARSAVVAQVAQKNPAPAPAPAPSSAPEPASIQDIIAQLQG